MSTPRTDAEEAKTLTPAYEYVGAETEAWEFSRNLEIQLAMVETLLEDTNQLVLGHVAENRKLKKELASAGLRIYELDEELEHVRESYEKYNLLSTRPFSELF